MCVVWYRYGHLTWEWEHRLRGFLHPGLFAAVFALLRLFHADSPLAIVRDYTGLGRRYCCGRPSGGVVVLTRRVAGALVWRVPADRGATRAAGPHAGGGRLGRL